MPLVRIALMKTALPGFGKRVGEIIFAVMTDTLNVPPKDNFQIITEHDPDTLIFDPSYLDIPRTDGLIIIQITLNEGRPVEMKKLFYKTLAERLHADLGLRTEDVLISLIEVKKENWSFGLGAAPYA